MIDVKRNDILRAQEQILEKDIEDEWVQTAALLSMPSDRLFTVALHHPDYPEFLEKVSAMIVRERKSSMLYARIMDGDDSDEWWYVPLLRGMALANATTTSSQSDVLIERMWRTENEETANAILELLPQDAMIPSVVKEAQVLSKDSQESIARRVRAIRVLSKASIDPSELLSLFTSQAPLDVQLEVLKGLQQTSGVEVAEHILGQWERLTPRLRKAALSVFNSSERAHLLIEALESGIVVPAELSWDQRVRLMRDTPEPTRSRARALLRVSDEIRSGVAEDIDGDAESGAYLYATMCASCHARGFGPDLATVRHWSEPMLASAIMKPSESISSGFELWQIVTTQGDTLGGVIISETASAVRLLSEDTDETIRRSEIASVTPRMISGMPEDLVSDPQMLADIIAFVREF